MATTLDHPRIRASQKCPLCSQFKDYGLVVCCWPCYHEKNLSGGNSEAEDRLDEVELELELEELWVTSGGKPECRAR